MTSQHPEYSQNEEHQPKWLGLFKHWERGLLILLAVAVLAMAGHLLWPKPLAVVTLKPYTGTLPQAEDSATQDAEALTEDEAATTEDETNFTGSIQLNNEDSGENKNSGTRASASVKGHQQPGSHPHFPKKPDHPPVTNLNTAKLQQLQLLPGIGPKMAERIVEYRKANGGFKSIEQVMEVKGIGPKKFEKMKPFLKV